LSVGLEPFAGSRSIGICCCSRLPHTAAIFKPPSPHPPRPANDLATSATWARLNLQMLQGRLGFDVSSSNHTI